MHRLWALQNQARFFLSLFLVSCGHGWMFGQLFSKVRRRIYRRRVRGGKGAREFLTLGLHVVFPPQTLPRGAFGS
jgi:hypothetical protein